MPFLHATVPFVWCSHVRRGGHYCVFYETVPHTMWEVCDRRASRGIHRLSSVCIGLSLLSVVCCMLSIVCYPLQAWDCQTGKVMPIHGGWPAVHSKLLGPSYVKDKCLGTFVPVSLLRVPATCNISIR